MECLDRVLKGGNTPLGTASAVLLARHYVDNCPEFLVLNGDSFLEVNLENLIDFHRMRAGAVVTIAVTRVQDASRYGTVQIESTNRINGFAEKTGNAAPGLINGGVYVFNDAVWNSIPEGPSSLEREVFSAVARPGSICFGTARYVHRYRYSFGLFAGPGASPMDVMQRSDSSFLLHRRTDSLCTNRVTLG